MRHSIVSILIGCIAILAVSAVLNLAVIPNAHAQPPTGTIWGLVTDPYAIDTLGGVQVRALIDGQEWGIDTTDAFGYYAIHELQAVPHDVEASMAGYWTQTQEDILVIADDSVRVDFELGQRGCEYIPGDAGGIGGANGIDVVFFVTFLKNAHTPPVVDCNPPCQTYTNPYPPHQQLPLAAGFYAACDVNGNCQANGVDVTFFVAFLKGWQPALLYCPDCPPINYR